MSIKSGMVVAGNTRYGRLIRTGQHTFEGERINAGGKFDTRKFSGAAKDVQAEWEAWRQKGIDAATIHVEQVQARQAARATEREEKKVTEAKQKVMYVLSFQGRQKKDVALFELEAALDASGMEGSYHVDMLPVWSK